MNFNYELLRIETEALLVEYFLVPWDTEIFGFPVAEIKRIELKQPETASREFARFLSWQHDCGIRLTSCRLRHDCLRESFFLEAHGFRFVEFVYPLRLDDIEQLKLPDQGIEWRPAEQRDLKELQAIGESAFATGRFNVDPKLGASYGGSRYAAWVQNGLGHPTQRVYKVTQNEVIAAFFITELVENSCAYWHLTAVAPGFQGQGIGKRAWRAMISLNRQQGARCIETTIAARNIPVVNLYAGLGFRFQAPLMTLHWHSS